MSKAIFKVPTPVNEKVKEYKKDSEELKSLLEKAGRDVKVADLDELGEFVVAAVKERRYIIGRDLGDTVELLHRRADAISDFLCPPHHEMGI